MNEEIDFILDSAKEAMNNAIELFFGISNFKTHIYFKYFLNNFLLSV